MKNSGTVARFKKEGLTATGGKLAHSGLIKGNLKNRDKPIIQHRLVRNFRQILKEVKFHPSQKVLVESVLIAFKNGPYKNHSQLVTVVEKEVKKRVKKGERVPTVSSSSVANIAIVFKRRGVIV